MAVMYSGKMKINGANITSKFSENLDFSSPGEGLILPPGLFFIPTGSFTLPLATFLASTGPVHQPIGIFFDLIGNGNRPLGNFSDLITHSDHSPGNFSDLIGPVKLPLDNFCEIIGKPECSSGSFSNSLIGLNRSQAVVLFFPFCYLRECSSISPKRLYIKKGTLPKEDTQSN